MFFRSKSVELSGNEKITEERSAPVARVSAARTLLDDFDVRLSDGFGLKEEAAVGVLEERPVELKERDGFFGISFFATEEAFDVEVFDVEVLDVEVLDEELREVELLEVEEEREILPVVKSSS